MQLIFVTLTFDKFNSDSPDHLKQDLIEYVN